MSLRNCYEVLESNQGVLDKREEFLCLVVTVVTAMFIKVVIRDCRPGVMSVI